jgi:hypothetical protein
MGDRRNVVLPNEYGESVALYTHWGGSELPATVADALARGKNRWTDETYLTRIIFSEMIKDEVLGETGYGIEAFKTGGTEYCEAQPGYDIEVNVGNQQVTIGENVYSFEHFVDTFATKTAPV